PYVNGYFIGSEGYIPAKDYSHKTHKHQTWQYAFQKQWLFYSVWGRLLYNPATTDELFENQFDARYPGSDGKKLLKASHLVSKTPLRFASFHKSTWDMTLYSEGFLSPRKANATSPFVNIHELINIPSLDPSYISIHKFVSSPEKLFLEGNITPLQLADSLETDSNEALKIVAALRLHANEFTGALACELDDIETWGHLGLYFSDKLRAGVALETFRLEGDNTQKEKAISLLNNCIQHWDKISTITEGHYHAVPYVDGDMFAWKFYKPEVAKDIDIANDYKFQGK
ncbi:MAG: hypothetical protein M3512_10120, partial [Bacteroidota bacterium]|nr:hypothetical protein [Bacteroidota bacterium]